MRHQGTTLLELLFVLAILAVMLLIAAPNYQRLLIQQQLSSSAQQMLASLNYARHLAVTQGGAYVCDGEQGCDDFQRPNAIEIFVSAPDGSLNSHQWQPFHPEISVQWRRFRGNHLYFNSQGRSVFSNGHFLLCHARHYGTAYKVVLNWSGRARIERTDADNC